MVTLNHGKHFRSRPDLVQVGDVVEWAGDDMLCTQGRVVAVLLPVGDVVVEWDLGSGWCAGKPAGSWGPPVVYEFEELLVYSGRPFTAIRERVDATGQEELVW